MIIVQSFSTDDGILQIRLELTYDETAVPSRLSSASATISLTDPDIDTKPDLSPPVSPPIIVPVVKIRMSGQTKFDLSDSGVSAAGEIMIQPLSSGTDGLWLNVFYGVNLWRHFEGIAVTFDRYLRQTSPPTDPYGRMIVR